MSSAEAAVSGTSPSLETAELPLRTNPPFSKQIDISSAQHIGDEVASPNYGVRVGGHVVACDQSQMRKNPFAQ